MVSNSKITGVCELLPPFFIMGCPRSGTTLVAQILNSHSRIAVYHETNYYPIFHPILHLYGDLRQSSNLMCLINHFLKLIQIQRVTPPEIEVFQKALVTSTFEGVLTTLLHLYARQQGKIRSGEKTPTHYRYLSEILEKFPESPVIFVIRDPRDTVHSIQKTFDSGIEDATWLWNEAFLSYSRVSSLVHLVRYEELVQKPVEVIKSICAFLGESYEPTMSNFFEQIPENLRLTHPKDLGKLSGPVVTTSIGNFQKMSTDDIKQIEAACAAGMEVLGYPFTASFTITAVVKTTPRQLNFLHFFFNRLYYYRFNRERWRRGFFRWKMIFWLYIRYLFRGKIGNNM